MREGCRRGEMLAMRIFHLQRLFALPTFTPMKNAVMLALSYDGENPAGWLMSEKLDGVRAVWTGSVLISRNGKPFHAPERFLAALPAGCPLDGELWMGRGMFQATLSTIKKTGSDWSGVRFLVFDAPEAAGGFEERLEAAAAAIAGSPAAEIHPHRVCASRAALEAFFVEIVDDGGEGVMLRSPGSAYERGRSAALLKYKPREDAEGELVGIEPGAGQFTGQAGALLLRWCGRMVKVGSGLTNALRINPPRTGALVTFQFCGLTDSGAPRFPVFLAVRDYE